MQTAISTAQPPFNWNEIWRESRKQKSGNRGRRDWNRRAGSFARTTRHSVYAQNFLARVRPKRYETVFDIGCGPGTLAIPLARKVRSVTAIDISQAMVSILEESCRQEGLRNVTCQRLSWQDDWDAAGIPEHDLVIASRSMVVDDLEEAILKMSAKARKKVYISSLVGDGPYDRRIFAAMGRTHYRGPDYLCIYNLLNQMGILADICFIESASRFQEYRDVDDAIVSFRWMTGQLTALEENLLYEYFSRHFVRTASGWRIDYHHIARWALISWNK